MKKYGKIFTFILIVFVAGSVAYATTVYYGQVNLNTATVEELMKLPYMNIETARNIINFRNSNGPFDSIDGLLNVEGMDKKALEKMKEYIKL